MKGDEAEYVVPLGRLFSQPRTKRARRSLGEIRRFVLKHTRNKNISITTGVNEFLWKNSYNIPHRVPVMLRKDGERIIVYLKGSRQIEEDKKKAKEAEGKAKKEKEGKEEKEKGKKEEKAEKKTDEAIKAEEDAKKKREEKRIKEVTAEKAEIKRKTARG